MSKVHADVKIRGLKVEDLDEVVRIDRLHTGIPKPDYWPRVFRDYLGRGGRDRTFGIGVDGEGGLAAYLFGEVRAAEFGSEPCGWIFAVGVDPQHLRDGVGSALLAEARSRFERLGVSTVRTRVQRSEIPVLSFFRSNGFVGGPYVQLEMPVADPEVME